MDIKNKLRQKIIEFIQNEFTIGRKTNHMPPFTSEQISVFVNTNTDKIDHCVIGIYEDFEADNKLDELVNPTDLQIYQYVYDLLHRIEYFD
jgi:hypothetical protein